MSAQRENPQVAPEIHAHYEAGVETGRLEGRGSLELERTQELIERFAPDPPAVVLDVGGGPGVYACWLAAKGYEVHLLDPVARHVDDALELAGRDPNTALASAVVGDARHLQRADDSVDLLLLFGPLYHLTERADRLRAWREARRVLRPGGLVLAAGISRFASVLDGLSRWLFADETFSSIVERDLREGQHRNPSGDPAFFTTAYFHHPAELAEEVMEAGLAHQATLAVEGPGWLMPQLVGPEAQERRPKLLELLRSIESEPSLLGASAHLIAVGRKA